MKRANPQGSTSATGDGDGSSSQADGKRKMMMMEEQDAGVDELLAALGYKVRSSDMADVAQKLEQLEMAMGGNSNCDMGTIHDETVLSHLATETVHYNPSDLSTWLENMLSEFNLPPPPPPPVPSTSFDRHPQQPPHREPIAPADSSSITTADLPSPPSKDNGTDPSREKKRMKSTASSSTDPTTHLSNNGSNLPVVMVDSQESGIRLVHALLACAEAVQHENLKVAESLVKQIGVLAMSQGGSMRKVATYFAEALARRIYRIYPSPDPTTIDSAFSDILQSHFYDSCPYLKFAHFTANQAILEAFNGRSRVHVIDFSMKQGMQWPPLMQALALRPGGPPFFRLTGVGPPQPDNTDALQQVGWKLAKMAETVNVEFEYRGFVANSLVDIESYMLELRNESGSESEVVAVNSVLELHRLLNRAGALEKALSMVKSVRPSIFTVVEPEANHNGPVFLDRFTEALHYYSSMFDSLETAASGQDQMMTEVYLGRQICNVVACEGKDRVERHETTEQWRRRMEAAGFEAAHLGSNAFKQASMLLELFAGGEGYKVDEKDGCLMLGWHTRPLITTSAWKPAAVVPPPSFP